MKKRLFLIACAGVMAGCQGPLPREARALYPQRDLTVLWSERHYWQVPPSGFPTRPTAAGENAVRAPGLLPALAPPLTATVVQPTAQRTRMGRRLGSGPRTVCAKPGC